MSRTILQRRVLRPIGLRDVVLGVPLVRAPHFGARAISAIPTVAQPSFWKSMIPKPLRRSSDETLEKKPKSKEWNPATFFIVIFLLIGSMSINMIALKKDFATFMRQSDVRIGLLREVVEKIQRGEKVDVEKVLGTGDPEKEAEWEQVLKEIEKDEAARNQKKKQPEPAAAPSPKAVAAPIRIPEEAEQQTSKPSSASFF
ncbi:hypothetical protein QBC46DRAFT_256413 [Diplogelasinospora grovesii]|uniref:Uncharacterized protein n=1 Tax=Diplogelasinospora grovesii TaxID=303347 RepID=A0AAN6S712_9PEZI|nr:hypothetical protein QBC46DRAFT_256413 [Diplogelasinospora grovesii]